SFLMYIFLLMAFFDLDGSEVMILSAIIWMLKQAGSYIVLFLLAGALLDGGGGGGGGAIGGMGGMGIVGGNEEMSAREIDASLGAILKDEPGVEARQWLA